MARSTKHTPNSSGGYEPDYAARVKAAKRAWPDGPWQREADQERWTSGRVYALILRSSGSGHWCGYVGVPCPNREASNQLYRLLSRFSSFGDGRAITFGPRATASPLTEFLSEPDPSPNMIWVGWDASHMSDFTPEQASRMPADAIRSNLSSYTTIDQARDATNTWAINLHRIVEVLASGASVKG